MNRRLLARLWGFPWRGRRCVQASSTGETFLVGAARTATKVSLFYERARKPSRHRTTQITPTSFAILANLSALVAKKMDINLLQEADCKLEVVSIKEAIRVLDDTWGNHLIAQPKKPGSE